MPSYSEIYSFLDETITGSASDDTILLTREGLGLNTIFAGQGNDTINGLGLAPSIVDGGTGADIFNFSGTVPTFYDMPERLVILLDVSAEDTIRIQTPRAFSVQSLFTVPDLAAQSYLVGYLPSFTAGGFTTGLLLVEMTGDRTWDLGIAIGSLTPGFVPPSYGALSLSTQPSGAGNVVSIRFSQPGGGGTSQDAVAGSVLTTASIAVGGSVNGTIDSLGDEDWFAVDLVAGRAYQFDLEGASSGHGTLSDPYLTLRSSTGVIVRQDDDGGTGLNSLLGFVPTAGGRYYLSAEAVSGTGTYRLRATDFNDVLASSATTASIAVGGGVTGTVDILGDEDWYAIDLVAGRSYVFELKGADSGSGTLGDPYLRLRGSSGTVVSFDDDGGTGFDSLLAFTATTGGRYYLSAGGLQETGTFQLRATATQSGSPAEFLLQRVDGSLFGWDQTRGGAGFTNLGVLDPGSSVLGVADFTGDGRADLLLRAPNGTEQLWDMSKGASGLQGLPSFGGAVPVAFGNFTGSSAADVLLRSPAGTLTFFDVAARTTRDFITPAPNFQVIGAGDVDRAGTSDVVFQNTTTGALLYWNGTGFRDLITLSPDSGWRVQAMGNFVGDAAADFLFFNQNSRAMLFWDIAKGSQGFSDFIGLPQDVSVMTTADFNGDGRDDILLRQGASARYWNGTQFVDASTILSPSLNLIGVGDIG